MESRRTQKIVTQMNKGGVTKTTVSINLAAACARAGLRTVLVDADVQANATKSVRVAPSPGLFDLLMGDKEFAQVLREVPADFAGMATELYIVPSDYSQRQVEQEESAATWIYERFQELDGWADVVIVDTSPGLSHVHAGFLYACDYVLLPTTLEFFSLTGLQNTLAYLDSARAAGAPKYRSAKVLGILPNRFAASEKVQQANVGFLQGRYGERYHIFPAMRNLTVWNQAAQFRKSIYAYSPADDYNARRQARTAAAELKPVIDAVMGLFAVEVAS